MLSELFLQAESLELSNIVQLGIVGFSLVLFALSLTAYRNTGLKRILFASIAFVLFAIQLFFDYIEEFFNFFEEDTTDLLLSGITLVILILLFVSLVKRK